MIAVSGTIGSGQSWLARLIYCSINNIKWTVEKYKFDYTKFNILLSHEISNKHSLQINGEGCAYNFYRLYCSKTILKNYQLKRHNSNRYLVSQFDIPNNVKVIYNDSYLAYHKIIVNNARICQEKSLRTGEFYYNWKDLFVNPSRVWNTINDFIMFHKRINYYSKFDFLYALDNYKSTCIRVNNTINANHYFFKAWQLAYLDINQKINADHVLINFSKKEINTLLKDYRNDTIDFTLSETFCYN